MVETAADSRQLSVPARRKLRTSRTRAGAGRRSPTLPGPGRNAEVQLCRDLAPAPGCPRCAPSARVGLVVRGGRGSARPRATSDLLTDPLQARACAVPALGIAAAYSQARTAHGPETVGGSILSGGGLQHSPEHRVAFERGQRRTESANRKATIPQLPGRSIDGRLLVSGALHREPHRTAGRGFEGPIRVWDCGPRGVRTYPGPGAVAAGAGWVLVSASATVWDEPAGSVLPETRSILWAGMRVRPVDARVSSSYTST